MATLREIEARFQALLGKEIEFAVESLNEEKQHILDLNREQLYDGKTKEGKDIHPTYYEDPYFKTLEAAIGYSNWKDKITPNPRRTKGVPNLFINGYYYRSIVLTVDKNGLHYGSSFDEENHMDDKYAHSLYGLDKVNRIELNKVTGPRSVQKIKAFLKL